MPAQEILDSEESDVEFVRSCSSQESKKKRKKKAKQIENRASLSKSKQARSSVPKSQKRLNSQIKLPILAPWPSTESQHVCPPSERTDALIHKHSFTTRVPHPPLGPSASSTNALASSSRTPTPIKPVKLPLDSDACWPVEAEADPLTARLLTSLSKNALPDFHAQQLPFTSLYAPTCVEEVLGSVSRASACFLRDWLHELQLRPATEGEERRIIRKQVDPLATSRKRKRRSGYDSEDSLADFIDDGPQHDDDEWGPSDHVSSSQPTPARSRFDPLSNLILLSGPTSSGKSSAVQAAAKQLGYAIFEVSPNQARGQRELLGAVGEVGRNHLVWNTQNKTAPAKKGSVMDFFSKARAKQGAQNGVDKGKAKEADSCPNKETQSVQQSLILIEEVDILFQQDKSHASFWDGVIHVVSKSHRPVILTCNDPSHIPFERLALQAALEFQKPSEAEVTSFLQTVSLLQGHRLHPHLAQRLYRGELKSNHAPPFDAGSQPPLTLCRPSPGFGDLRHALQQLQLCCSRVSDQQGWVDIEPEMVLQQKPAQPECATSVQVDIKAAATAADLSSFVDAFIDRPEALHRTHMDGDATAPADQLELEHCHLRVHVDPCGPGGLTTYMLDEEIASDIRQRSYGRRGWTDATDTMKTLAQERSRALDLMDQISAFLPISAPLLPSPDLLCDYLPQILTLTHLDDLHEQAWMQATLAQAAVPTDAQKAQRRRSRRLHQHEPEAYQRYLDDLTGGQLEAAWELRQRFDCEVEQQELRRDEAASEVAEGEPPSPSTVAVEASIAPIQ